MDFKSPDNAARERAHLAPFAQRSSDTRGRFHSEPPSANEFRTPYQRDRDRVIHARAFRRLESKTQVFLSGTGDHLRNRLTHTIEVAAIARNIARALRLNEDLAETVALAHDLGHAPFGHKAEESLDRLMADHGGFEHNAQSLRIVERLEQKYPGFHGLNLSWETREGLIKHRTPHDAPKDHEEFLEFASPTLEAQVANLADEIAYYSHDLDDGLESGLLDEGALRADVPFWAISAERVEREFGRLADERRRYYTIRCIIDLQVKDVIRATSESIANAGVTCADDVRRHPELLVRYSAELGGLSREVRAYLYENLYYNPAVRRPNDAACLLLEDLFGRYVEKPEEMPEFYRDLIEEDGLHRAVCDYLSGMTDRYAIADFEKRLGRPAGLPRSSAI